MPNRFLVLVFLFMGMLFFHFSYATAGKTKLTSSKFDTRYNGGQLKSVMVVALAKKPQNRKIFEDTFAKEFQNHGVKVVPSMEFVPKGKKLEKSLLKTEAEKLGIQFLFVIRLLGIEEKTEEIAVPVGGLGINLPGNRYNMPTLGIKETRVRLESRLYEFKSERLIWSGTSESLDPKSTEEIVRQLSRKVIKNLRKNKMLK